VNLYINGSDLKKGVPVKDVEAQAQTEEEEIIIQANKPVWMRID